MYSYLYIYIYIYIYIFAYTCIACFGDLSQFSQQGGNGSSFRTGSEDMKALSKCLYELCDVLRHVGFTVTEMFNGFDRNGSGKISVSEFCSLLRLVLGSTFDKRIIYRYSYVYLLICLLCT
jgi:hypothetical protein